MKTKADTKRREVNYQIGDWVLLRLRPYRQSSAKGLEPTTGKLSKRFFGPFQVVERVGKVAYRLQLPAKAKVHPAFHYSLLKRFHGDPAAVPAAFLAAILTSQPSIAPLAILAARKASNATTEVLVQWQGLSPDDATWEDWIELRNEFHLEDKVLSHGPWNDTEEQTIAVQAQDAGPIAEPISQTREQEENAEATDQQVQLVKRPKRVVTKPSYLKDYV
ncbi:hypothetical protein JHK86_021937 [Glycine max]|nr:hypothetical protein JHK86_021937 [Glycine max]